jgi:alcohol dehydrogenase class IV
MLARYAELGRAMGGGRLLDDEDAAVDAGLEVVRDLVRELGIPGLARYGLTEAAIPDIVEMARRASSMRFNPVELSPRELTEILSRAS